MWFKALVCASPIEAQYYESVLVKFPPTCYHCSLGEESLANDRTVQELKKKYDVVYPIFFFS